LASFLVAGVILYESTSYFYLLDFPASGVKTYEATGSRNFFKIKVPFSHGLSNNRGRNFIHAPLKIASLFLTRRRVAATARRDAAEIFLIDTPHVPQSL